MPDVSTANIRAFIRSARDKNLEPHLRVLHQTNDEIMTDTQSLFTGGGSDHMSILTLDLNNHIAIFELYILLKPMIKPI